MTEPPDADIHSEVESVIGKVISYLNDRAYYPREGDLTDRCLLGLISKAIDVARSVRLLAENNLPGEALALSRTETEIFLLVRYICNKDTTERATSFMRFCSAHVKNTEDVRAKYATPSKRPPAESKKRLLKISEEYGTRLKGWKKYTRLVSDQGESHINDVGFHFEGIFEMQSHEVHATSVSLSKYDLTPGKPFVVGRQVSGQEKGIYAEHLALCYLTMILVLVEQKLGLDPPAGLVDELRSVYQMLLVKLPQDRLMRQR